MGRERYTTEESGESHPTSLPGNPRSGVKFPRIRAATAQNDQPTIVWRRSSGLRSTVDGSYGVLLLCKRGTTDITTKTSKRPRTLPLYPPKDGPYNTLLRFYRPSQGTEPHSRPVKVSEATLVHLHGPRANSCPMWKCWYFLHGMDGKRLPLQVSSASS